VAERNAGHAQSTFTRRPYPDRTLAHLTSLVGRDSDIVLVTGRSLSPSHRLLTLIGPGGVGKSCLAAAVADRLTNEFTDAIWHVDLAEVTVPSLTDAAVAEALGLTRRPGRPVRDEVTGFLAGIDALLILDGCEHLADTASPLIADLLASCPGLRVLATSRTPLRVEGEHLIPVAPLRTPDASERLRPHDLEQVPSVTLFTQRVRAVNPGFVLTAENAEIVAEICTLLDGLPTAIEIAADRARLLGMSRLLSRLRDGRDILRRGHLDVPDRHRSLRAITEWSYRLLDPDQQALLDVLSVCEGGFGFGTVEAVAPASAAVDHALETLVDANLVFTSEQPDGELRFGLPATVRAFCGERLRASERLSEARRRHAEYIRAQVTTPPNEGLDQPARLRRLALERGNVRAALDYFTEQGDHAAASETALAASELYLVRGPLEDELRRIKAIAFRDTDGTAELADLLASVAIVAGRLAVALGDPARAVEVCERARDLQRDDVGEAVATAELGRALTLTGARDRARTLLTSGIAKLRSMGETVAATPAVLTLAAEHRADHDLEQAEELLTGVMSTSLEYGDVHGVALAEAQLALAEAERGRTSCADRYHRRSLRRLLDLEDHLSLATGLGAYALFLWGATGQGSRAVRLLAAAEALRRTVDVVGGDAGVAARDEACRRLRIDLGAPGFDAAWDEGGRLGGRAAAIEALSTPTVSGGAPAVPSAPRHQLTPRQFEVATLVARGMTNRQISRELDISQWTVVNHIREVMRKLNVPSRVHVAQWVAQRN
jgi:predicted ATPase/DNA-binding CsgD family transcriptional regulator